MPNPSPRLVGAVLYVAVLMIAAGCGDRPSSATGSESLSDTAAAPADTSATDTSYTEPREFPLLTPDNAVPFLKKWLKDQPERKIKLTTRLGTIKFRLFDDTPIHTANFLMLVKRHYFDHTEFTRVVKNFVVQGGNNDKESEEIKRLLIGSYELPPEIRVGHIHRRGALAMARRYEDNPREYSSAYNFYFVQGQKFSEPQLLALERNENIKIPEWKRKIYRTVGGAPHLDGRHTVFGEIYEGLDVLDAIANVKTDKADWPLDPVIMKMEIIDE